MVYQAQKRRNPYEDLVYCIKRIFNQPALGTICGEWKSGKTDFALFLAVDIMLRLGIVNVVGSNIKTEDSRVDYVASSQKLKYWLHRDRRRKCYVFDEAIKHAYKRTPMARTQVSLIQVITELSKGHGRGLIVSQDPFMIDKDLINPVFCRVLFIKGGYHKRQVVELISHLIDGGYRKWRGIPPTTVKFDPWIEADFSELEEAPMLEIEEIKYYHSYFMEGIGYNKIAKEFDKHPEHIRRKIRKVAKVLYHLSLPKADEVKKILDKVKEEP